jgi:adenylate cyclase
VLSDIARQFEAVAYDLRLRTFAERIPDPRQPVVIVDLDEASLAEEGQWPWPRARIADLVERLAAGGAAVIAFDVVFSEPELNPVDRVLAEAGDVLDEPARAALRRRAPALDGDAILAARIAGLRDAEVSMGAFLGQGSVSVGAPPDALLRLDAGDRTTLLRFDSWTGPPASLLAHTGSGHIITVPDDLDGVIRRAPLVVRLGDDVVPALAVDIVRSYLLLEELELETDARGGALVPRQLRLGDAVNVPLDARGRVLVPYRGPAGTFPYLPAADVLRGRLSESERRGLEDAIVLIGTSSIGLADLRSTPTARVFPGVEVHATLVDALLEAARRAGEGDPVPAFPREPDLSVELTVLGLLLAGILLSLAMPLLGASAITLVYVLTTATWMFVNVAAWTSWGIALPTVSPLLLLLALTFSYLLRGFVREASTRRGLRQMFDQYVPPAHIERMVNSGHATTLDGDSRVMTVLFADIQGFTRMSEGLPAPDVRRVLNDFFTPITATILEHQGTIDKYVGDMIMAFWNAPLVDPDHREHALAAALQMVRIMEELKGEFEARGLPPVEVGIGLNTGTMNVGDMGSEFRRAYTVLGDAVNIGSRIEGLTRRYGVRVLVGEQTRDEARGWVFRFIDRVQVKGASRSLRIYEPVCPASELDAATESRLLRWHGAYWKFSEQDFDGAARDLDALIEADPECRLYHLYRARVDEYREQTLPVHWDAAVVMEEK